jgi:hypothetical protein
MDWNAGKINNSERMTPIIGLERGLLKISDESHRNREVRRLSLKPSATYVCTTGESRGIGREKGSCGVMSR